jgi:nucleolar protein 15
MRKKASDATHASKLGVKKTAETKKKPPSSRKASAVTPDIEVKASKDGKSNIIYVGHVPHGFYEKQMKDFFTQFGHVTNLRLSRNKKTTKSRGYGFVQFQSVEVAAITAEAMDGCVRAC